MARAFKRILWIVVLVCLVMACAVAVFHPASRFTAAAIEPATVVRVVDGDTLVVDISGTQSRVRLKGVDTPESVHPDASRNTPEGAAASEFAKSAVPAGSTVWLQRDTRGDDVDAHGRLLRYVWLCEPDTASMPRTRYIADHMLEGVLLSAGYAGVYAYNGEVFDYRPQFEAIAHGL